MGKNLIPCVDTRLSVYTPKIYLRNGSARDQRFTAGERASICVRFNAVAWSRPVHESFRLYAERIGPRVPFLHWKTGCEIKDANLDVMNFFKMLIRSKEDALSARNNPQLRRRDDDPAYFAYDYYSQQAAECLEHFEQVCLLVSLFLFVRVETSAG
jgi:hypothetical protein